MIGIKKNMKTLFDSTTLRSCTLRNRAWRSATWLGLADANGFMTDAIISTYEALAKGGAAVIVTGLTSVSATDAHIGGECKFYGDCFIEGHRQLTNAVHRQGAHILLQTAMVDGPVDELTTAQVDDVVAAFGDAARRAEQAGYDGVQIHAAHFFYISRFISPLFNHRTDGYRGSGILPAILADMRDKTSDSFLITMKINSSDGYPGGMEKEEMVKVCRPMTDLDAIEVSANGTSQTGIRAGVNEGPFLEAATQLAEAMRVPVVLVGGLRSVEFIHKVLNDTGIEYVSLSRPLIREPELIRRWQQGDTAPSRCVSCNACYNTSGHQCVFTAFPSYIK